MTVVQLHVDTDFGGDPDDACALVMLLGRRDVEIVGITTVLDADGQRAAYVRRYLELADRLDIPVAVGCGASLTTGERAAPVGPDDRRHWPAAIPPFGPATGAATELLAGSIATGATILAIGPWSNLAALERARPGALADVPVVAMGGWVDPPPAGLPPWGPEMDFNVQFDVDATALVAAVADLTLVTLPATMTATLRATDLPRLRAARALGELLAAQSVAHADDSGMAALGVAHAALPDDLVNFHWDPVAGAVALGWPGATLERVRLDTVLEHGTLRFVRSPTGRATNVVTAIDGEGFRHEWLAAVEAATSRANR
jgi:inosine-uridine nucleoside N-ribohydrolase